MPYRPTVDITDYPKAGDPNPLVTLGIARAEGGTPAWADLSAYSGTDLLIVDVDWHPEGADVVYQVQDREQTWLDLNLADARTGRSKKILRETTPAWVERNGNPLWLKDGSFLWLSERNGFRHLYQYRADGTQIRQITSGRWEVRPLYGVDQDSQAIYFASGEHSSIGTDIYRIRLDGSALTRLSKTEGTHRAIFNPRFTQYVDAWSDVSTPPQVRLHRADGTELRVIDGNRVRGLADYRLAKPEFVQVKARDGFVLDAMMIKPPDFDPSRRYPVFEHTYSGPGAPEVRNQWGGRTYMFHQMLAQQGVVVWVLDNRSASRKGVESQWPIYGRLGELELRDLEDGVAWLKRQPYIDASRIMLSGTSYGGFMAAYALTHSSSWVAGIADAAVTDWRDYDTIYTERYMKLPTNNPDGYQAASPRFAADRLRGRLLIVHGTIDDNVHMQNAEQFIYELQKAGKSFEVMVYPRSRHGIADPLLNKHLRQTMFDFITRTIGQNARTSALSASK
jgi:dipeptidyl-peptidase-4